MGFTQHMAGGKRETKQCKGWWGLPALVVKVFLRCYALPPLVAEVFFRCYTLPPRVTEIHFRRYESLTLERKG